MTSAFDWQRTCAHSILTSILMIGVADVAFAKRARNEPVKVQEPVRLAPVPAPAPPAVIKVTPAANNAAATKQTDAKTSANVSAKSATKTDKDAKRNDDDDDDDDDPKTAAGKARRAAVDRERAVDASPPQTLVDLISRMAPGKPAPAPAPAPAPGGTPAASLRGIAVPIKAAIKPAAPWGETKVTSPKGAVVVSPASPKPTVPVSRTAPTPSLSPLQIPVVTSKLPGREILAPKLPPEALAKAVGLGFAVAAPSKGASDPLLTQLVPPDGMSAAEAQKALRENISVGQFYRNMIYRPYKGALGGEDDAQNGLGGGNAACPANRCYASQLLQWRQTLGQCAKRARIAVIDTGFDPEHPAFSSGRIAVAKVAPRENLPITANWHGTGVLAILSGSPESTTPGLVPDAEFLLVDVFFGDSRGQPMSDSVSLVAALRLIERFRFDVVNLSLSGPRDPLVEQEIERLSAAGVVFIAAAGNEGPGASPSYPAAYKGVIAVTAVNRELHGYRHANQGNYIDVAAPGVGIWTALPGRKEGYLTGTSFAVPYMTAVVAVMHGQIKGWSKERILDRLEYKDLGTPGRDPVFGRGLVQAPSACGPGPVSGSFEMAVKATDAPVTLMRVSGPTKPAGN